MKDSDVLYCRIIEKLVYIELLLENKEVEKAFKDREKDTE